MRLAVGLQFAVKLELGQPDPALVRELHEVLDRYLHQTTVAQPVEFFHSSLLAYSPKWNGIIAWMFGNSVGTSADSARSTLGISLFA